MTLLTAIEHAFLRGTDAGISLHRQPMPARGRLARAKIVSHRGQHDNRTIFENTLAAFDQAAGAGVWGIELDIRWTRDLQPVVCHDPDLKRVFGLDLAVDQTRLDRLKSVAPEIPLLSEVIRRYGGKHHLMLEIKSGYYPHPPGQAATLKTLLSPLAPVRDYHLISLRPQLFAMFSSWPPRALLPIARLNAAALSRLSRQRSYGGLAGHYALLSTRVLCRHLAAGQSVGTGFIASRNVLFREINRGVEWLFSNRAVQLQALCNRLVKF